jgi:hypothetical protein
LRSVHGLATLACGARAASGHAAAAAPPSSLMNSRSLDHLVDAQQK